MSMESEERRHPEGADGQHRQVAKQVIAGQVNSDPALQETLKALALVDETRRDLMADAAHQLVSAGVGSELNDLVPELGAKSSVTFARLRQVLDNDAAVRRGLSETLLHVAPEPPPARLDIAFTPHTDVGVEVFVADRRDRDQRPL